MDDGSSEVLYNCTLRLLDFDEIANASSQADFNQSSVSLKLQYILQFFQGRTAHRHCIPLNADLQFAFLHEYTWNLLSENLFYLHNVLVIGIRRFGFWPHENNFYRRPKAKQAEKNKARWLALKYIYPTWWPPKFQIKLTLFCTS